MEKKARPWDIFNKNIKKVSQEIYEKRMSICRSCDFFISATTQCKQCGCIMNLKTKLPHADCPVGKWGKEKINIYE